MDGGYTRKTHKEIIQPAMDRIDTLEEQLLDLIDIMKEYVPEDNLIALENKINSTLR